MKDLKARIDADLIGGFYGRFASSQPITFGNEVGQLTIVPGQALGKRVIGGNSHEGCAIQCVVTGCENF